MHKKLMIGIAFVAMGFTTANAQEKMKPEDTEFYTPVPPVVTPGKTCGDALLMQSYYLMEKTFRNGFYRMTLPKVRTGMCIMEYLL